MLEGYLPYKVKLMLIKFLSKIYKFSHKFLPVFNLHVNIHNSFVTVCITLLCILFTIHVWYIYVLGDKLFSLDELNQLDCLKLAAFLHFCCLVFSNLLIIIDLALNWTIVFVPDSFYGKSYVDTYEASASDDWPQSS